MEKIKNIFGEGTIYKEEDLKGKIYITSAACMSVWSDALSYANRYKQKIIIDPSQADTIIVLGCQVTDLAILNDIEIAYKLHKKYNKDIYMGGCLAQRLDIKLPDFIKRLDVVRVIGEDLKDRSLVHYEKPFWVPGFEENDDNLSQGNLFRNFYPLKIGAGCHGKCKYCTIKHTRGQTYFNEAKDQIQEFLSHDNVVLISDSPNEKQIKSWSEIALRYQKPISIRNIEPQNLIKCSKELHELADNHLLTILHCPVQSFDEELLKVMNRNVPATKEALKLIYELREKGVITATNIIIDYTVGDDFYPNYDLEQLNKYFDYFSWNPYFDGNFDFKKAKQRFRKYIK